MTALPLAAAAAQAAPLAGPLEALVFHPPSPAQQSPMVQAAMESTPVQVQALRTREPPTRATAAEAQAAQVPPISQAVLGVLAL